MKKSNVMGKVAVDELILIKDKEAAAGSKILKGFKHLFSAEVIERLEKCGMDFEQTPTGEFGLDLLGEFSCGNEQKGKLKGEAAELVKSGKVCFGLGVDMNGFPRRAAAVSGVDFLKPTYGTVSRYGIISCAASGEQIGVYGKTAGAVAAAMGMIAGHDDKDGTSLPDAAYDYTISDVKGKKVALIENLAAKAGDDVKALIEKEVKILEKRGVKVDRIKLDDADLANVAWEILMSAETCNNISRYDGVKFGYRAEKYKDIDELYVNSRTEGFNFLTKATVLYGSDALSKKRYKDCYEKSLKVRRLVQDELKALFEKYDAALMPACSTLSFESYDIKDAFGKTFDEMVFTSLASITGMPALVSGGVQLMGKAFSESTLLSIASAAEKEDK